MCTTGTAVHVAALAPIWLFKSYTTRENVRDTCVHTHYFVFQ